MLQVLADAGGEDGPVARAYLGEAARQGGDLERALALLAAAAADGYRDPFVVDAAHKAAFQMRAGTASKAFDGLPDYVPALEAVLAAYGEEPTALHGVLARWLLDDYGAYAVPGRDRATLWASTAAGHALAALVVQGVAAAGDGTRLAFDAAAALAPEDGRAAAGRSASTCSAWAYRLGNRPDDDTHALPAAVALLAEAALARGAATSWPRASRVSASTSPTARRRGACWPRCRRTSETDPARAAPAQQAAPRASAMQARFTSVCALADW